MINYTAPINDLSYGIVGGNLLLAMSRKVGVTLFPISLSTTNQEFAKSAQEAVKRQENFHPDAPSLRLWHQFDLAQHVGGGPHINYSIFETNKFTDREWIHVGSSDIFFVCSEWFKKTTEMQLPNLDVRVAPLGVDRSIFYEDDKSEDSWTTFLNVGKWEYRKGHDVLAKAFNLAFQPSDRVRLWMSTHNIFLTPERNKGVDGNKEWEKKYKGTKMGGKISFIKRQATQQDMAQLISEADCGIFPSRSEGWNLPLLEMMSCGKDVIATNFSAHTEFCNEENCLLVNIEQEEKAEDGVWFKGDVGTWADVSTDDVVDQLVEKMRFIHHEKQYGKLERNRAGIETAKEFSWDNTAAKILVELTKNG